MAHPDKMSKAEQFLISVREERKRTGQTLAGKRSISSSIQELIANESFNASLKNQFNIRNLKFALTETVEAFVELARRLDMPVPSTLIPSVTRCLLLELSQNCIAFNELQKPTKLKALTVNHGVSFINTLTAPEYAALRDTPDIFKLAATSHPSDPYKFLSQALAKAHEQSKDMISLFEPQAPQKLAL